MFKRVLNGVKKVTQAVVSFAVKTIIRDGDEGWTSISRSGGGPADRSWAELQIEFRDVLEAWRLNP